MNNPKCFICNSDHYHGMIRGVAYCKEHVPMLDSQAIKNKEKQKDMKHYLCESCNKRWSNEGASPRYCPECESVEIRETMSLEEAERLGLK